MQLVATKLTGEFFRAQSITESVDEQATVKAAMEADAGEKLNFQIMTDVEFEDWLSSQ